MNRQTLTAFSFALLILVLASAGPLLAQSFREPGGSPPGGSVVPPLNASSSTQRKSGSLIIGQSAGAAVFCLNPDATNSSLDPASNLDCISNWTNLVAPLGGPFVRINTGVDIPTDSFKVGNYQLQSGYARITATDDRQAFSLMAKAASVCLDQSNEPCIWTNGAGICRCSNNPASSCIQNTDCIDPQTNRNTVTTAVYGTDGGNANNKAGVFEGRLFIQGNLCLNGIDTGSCIASWDEIAGAGTVGYVKLQSSGPSAQPTEIQSGAAKTSGVGRAGSFIAGNPAATPPNINNTCGDGFCHGGNEDANSCAFDCSTISPIQSFAASPAFADFNPYPSAIGFDGTIGTQPFSNPVKLLIVGSTGSPPTFSPVAGQTYSAYETYGNSMILYYGDQTQNASITGIFDDPYATGQTQYYTAFLGDQYPRWSAGVTTSYKGWRLTINRFSGGTVYGPGIECRPGCSVAYALFADNQSIQLTGAGTTFSGACTGVNSCSLIMNSNKTVNAN